MRLSRDTKPGEVIEADRASPSAHAAIGLLLVESDPAWGAMLAAALRFGGYPCDVAGSAADVDQRLEQDRFAAIILDLDDPELGGHVILASLREQLEQPLLVLTSGQAPSDWIDFFDLGADAVLIKPFAPRELLARLRSALRRYRSHLAPQRPKLAPSPEARARGWRDVRVDRVGRRLWFQNRCVWLTKRELQLYDLMLAHFPKVITPAEIELAMFGQGRTVSRNLVPVFMSKLRSKLKELCAGRNVIKSYRGKGWALDEL
jgi:DNA-binding response OmpR family regulator